MKQSELELLVEVAGKIKTGCELMGSKWQNVEAEIIAMQTLTAAANNYKDHGEVLSWAGGNLNGIAYGGGINNPKGLEKLISDGSIVVEHYDGKLVPSKPKGIQKDEQGRYIVLRPTASLVYYAASVILGR